MAAERILQAMFVDAARSAAARLPAHLTERAVRRLRWAILTSAAILLPTIPLRSLAWGKPSTLITISDAVTGGFSALSVAVFLVLRFGRVPSSAALKVGLVYEILLCFTVALIEQILVGFERTPFRVSAVAIVLLTFPLFVPSPPRWRLIATGIAALMQPAALVLVQWIGRRSIDGVEIATATTPTMLVAFLAAWLSQVVHRLRLDVGHAMSFGQYELVRKLGEGGMGEVWEAKHTHLVRPAAVKLIRPDSAYGNAARARFRREAQATSALRSPHTVALYDFGTTADGTLYYAMELLEGIDLERLVKRFGALSPARALHVIAQVARSLAEAHELGLVHRDIKPANVYVCRVGIEVDFVKVLDFGLVKPRFVGDEGMVSIAGAVSGTPGYVAPEHAAGQAYDGRADLYSLGCVAYYLLTAQRVFVRPTRMAMLAAHMKEDPVAPSLRVKQLGIPPAIDRLILDLLARDPALRIGDARELLDRIEEVRRELHLEWTPQDAHAWWAAHVPEMLAPKPQLVL